MFQYIYIYIDIDIKAQSLQGEKKSGSSYTNLQFSEKRHQLLCFLTEPLW